MRPPRLTALAAVTTAVVGLGVAGIMGADPRLAIGGLLLVGLAVGLWAGWAWARLSALVVGAIGLLPLVWGVYGLAVVAEEWFQCADGRLAVASIVATSYPAGWCVTRNWLATFGTGLALVGVGLAGLIVFAAAAREWRHLTFRNLTIGGVVNGQDTDRL
jgi:hypothetical protein